MLNDQPHILCKMTGSLGKSSHVWMNNMKAQVRGSLGFHSKVCVTVSTMILILIIKQYN